MDKPLPKEEKLRVISRILSSEVFKELIETDKEEMAIHLCPNQECQATHRDNGIFRYRNEYDPVTFTRFEPPIVTPEFIEHSRLLLAHGMGAPEDIVEVAFVNEQTGCIGVKLAPGWTQTQKWVKIDENRSYLETKVVRIEDDGNPQL